MFDGGGGGGGGGGAIYGGSTMIPHAVTVTTRTETTHGPVYSMATAIVATQRCAGQE